MAIAGIHFSRKDHRFIELVAMDPYLIYLVEYGALLFPFIILSWIGFGQPLFMLTVIPVMAISFFKVQSKSVVSFSFSDWLITDTNFEWKAGMRKTGGVLIVIWLVALALTAVPFASIVALWFFLPVVASFYDEGEPREMVESYQLNAKEFIKRKLIDQLLSFLKPVIPVLVISIFFFPDRWWVLLLLFLVFSSLNISVFVLSKYAVWRPSEINRSGSILNTVCMLGLFLPFLLPLPILVLVRNYRKSVLNLNPMLHDYH